MSAVSLCPLAEHVYNILLLNEKQKVTEMNEARIRTLKVMANNIQFLIRLTGGPMTRCNQVTIPCTILHDGRVCMSRVGIALHSDDGSTYILLEAVGKVCGTIMSINEILDLELLATINARLDMLLQK
jgi:hypothetical protein